MDLTKDLSHGRNDFVYPLKDLSHVTKDRLDPPKCNPHLTNHCKHPPTNLPNQKKVRKPLKNAQKQLQKYSTHQTKDKTRHTK